MAFPQNNPNREPWIMFSNGEDRVCARRVNTHIFRFWGEWAVANHAFVITGEVEGNQAPGLYIWEHYPDHTKLYKKLYKMATAEDWTVHSGLQDIADQDREQWERAFMPDLTDYPPEFEDETRTENTD